MTLAIGVVLVLAGLGDLAAALVAPGPAGLYAVGGVIAVIAGAELTRAALAARRARRRAARRGGYLI